MLRQRHPHVADRGYLAFLHDGLPSIVSGRWGEIHAAHIRFGSISHGKRPSGAGEKPDDRWAVPLLAEEHVFGNEAQHNHGERLWWVRQGIDPILIAALLFSHYKAGDQSGALAVCQHAKIIAPWRY